MRLYIQRAGRTGRQRAVRQNSSGIPVLWRTEVQLSVLDEILNFYYDDFRHEQGSIRLDWIVRISHLSVMHIFFSNRPETEKCSAKYSALSSCNSPVTAKIMNTQKENTARTQKPRRRRVHPDPDTGDCEIVPFSSSSVINISFPCSVMPWLYFIFIVSS